MRIPHNEPLKSGISVVELLAATLLPWALFFLIRALQAFNSARAWRWVGLLGLTLALIAGASSLAFSLFAVAVIIAAVSHPKRGLILIWSLLPSGAVLYPLLKFVIESKDWPSLLNVSAYSAAPIAVFDVTNLVVLGIAVLLSFPSWFIADAKTNYGFFGFAIAALCLATLPLPASTTKGREVSCSTLNIASPSLNSMSRRSSS